MKPVRPILPLAVAAAATLACGPLAADTTDVARGAAGQPAGAAPVAGAGERDPAGLGPYRVPASRSPAGTLYDIPFRLPELQPVGSGWQAAGEIELGWLGAGADHRSALWRTYRDPAAGPVISRFGVQGLHAGQARWFEFGGSAIGSNEQAIGLRLGRYNDHRVSLSYNETPHVGSTTARPIWQGLGTGELTLTPAPGIAAGGASTNNAANAAAVQRLVARTPDTMLGLVRRNAEARIDLTLADGWSLSSSWSLLRRRGTRAFGANEGNGELVEPIDDRTHDLRAVLQFADDATHFNLSALVSLYRNAIDTLTWENPFQHPVGNLRILGGRADLYPDNEAYRIKADFARALPALWRARLTASVEWGAMRQNDRLIPPTVTRGIGAPFGNGFDGNFDRWNTLAALSRERAEAAIDTRLADLGLTLAPLDTLQLRATLRHHETRNRTSYTAFNPQTGQYGYIIQDTNASTIFGGSNNIHYRSIPFQGAQDRVRVAADLQLRRRATLGVEVEREEIRRDHRERERTWDDRVRVTYTDRGFDATTLRISVEQADRGGTEYVSNPYREFYTETLPGYTETLFNLLARLHNLEELRMFDLADRRQRIAKVRVNHMPGRDIDLGLTLQSRSNQWLAPFGRTGAQENPSLSLDAGWLPTASTQLHAHATHQRSRMRQAGVGDTVGAAAAGCASLPPSCSNRFAAPRSIYPAELAWTATSRERSTEFGVGLRHAIGPTQLDVQFTRIASRSPLGYTYASAGALQSPSAAALVGDGFADMTYRLQALDASLRWPLSRMVALRLFARLESARIADWHYSGLEQGTVVGNRLYLDAGPAGYRANLLGLMVQIGI